MQMTKATAFSAAILIAGVMIYILATFLYCETGNGSNPAMAAMTNACYSEFHPYLLVFIGCIVSLGYCAIAFFDPDFLK